MQKTVKNRLNYSVGYINETTLDQALTLLRDFSGNKVYYGADEKYARWQYFDSPFKTTITGKDDYSILTFVDDKKNILALEAFLPWKTLVNGKEIDSLWEMEWINFSKIRGLGRELTKILRKKTRIFCVYGLNNLSLNAYGKLGYSIRNEIERRIAVLDSKKCIELLVDNKVNGQKEFFMQKEVNCLPGSIKYFYIKDAEGLSERYWLDHVERFPVTSIKDARVLKWRYFEHPHIDYKVISLDREAKTGLAVLRMEGIRGSRGKVLRILELFPARGYERELVKAVLKFGFDQKAILADFFCVSERYCDEICGSPFVPLSEHMPYRVPMLFHPVEVREETSINMVMDHDKGIDVLSFDDFYATKGDSDRDVFIRDD